jgi:hypothetical protein
MPTSFMWNPPVTSGLALIPYFPAPNLCPPERVTAALERLSLFLEVFVCGSGHVRPAQNAGF